jgi:hypothetical protein
MGLKVMQTLSISKTRLAYGIVVSRGPKITILKNIKGAETTRCTGICGRGQPYNTVYCLLGSSNTLCNHYSFIEFNCCHDHMLIALKQKQHQGHDVHKHDF